MRPVSVLQCHHSLYDALQAVADTCGLTMMQSESESDWIASLRVEKKYLPRTARAKSLERGGLQVELNECIVKRT